MVAEITMASRTDRIIGPIALSPAREIGFDPEPEDQPVVVRLPQVTHDGMAYFSSSLQVGGVEPEVAGSIQNAWKQSTKGQYFAVWKQWTAWCGRSGINDSTPSAVNLIRYLWYLYSERRLAWRTIGIHRSAVATILQPYAPETISKDKRVRRFMKATFLSRPPARKIKPIWDVGTVLKCLETWGEIEDLSRVRLTHSLVMIMAIASARRVSDPMLHPLQAANCCRNSRLVVDEDGYSISKTS